MAIKQQENKKAKIQSTKFVYCVAVSGCGKSFTGDYLNVMHDFSHVDGDNPLKNCHVPKNKDMSWKLLKCITAYGIIKNEHGPKNLWQPYMAEIADQALDAAAYTDKVVLSHATPRQEYREFVVKKWIDAGALQENITVLQLTIDPEVKLKGLYYRTKLQCEEGGGGTLGDMMRASGWDGKGEPTISDYLDYTKEKDPNWNKNSGGFMNVPNGYKYLKSVDVSGRDMSHLDGVDKALDLVGERNNELMTFEEIRDKVKPLDAKRDEAMGENFQSIMEMFADAHGLVNGTEVDESKYDDNVTVDLNSIADGKNQKRHSSLLKAAY